MTSSTIARCALLATTVALTGGIQMLCRAAAEFRELIAGKPTDSYRPELHYTGPNGTSGINQSASDHPIANCGTEPVARTARHGGAVAKTV